MAIEGKISSLYNGSETQIIFPRTKTKAISDDNGNQLDSVLENLEAEVKTKASETFVTNKIAEAQLGGDNSEIDLSGYATKDELSALTAEDVGARPSSWMPTAAEVGARPNTWLPTIAEIGAAPAGYGLGNSVSRDWADVDDTYAPGWYKFQGFVSVDGVSLNSPFMRVDSWDMNNCAQTLFPLGSEAACLTRRRTGGVWGAWEWINPPMSPNVEYRTTELHNGKVVYTKLVQFGALPNNTEKSVTAMPAGSSLIEAVGYASGSSYNVAIPGYYAIQSFGSTRSSGNLWLSTTIDMSSYNGWITIKYTKD